MARNLDIALLRAFVAVADQRSMTAASQILHLTQGAISQQIARLEQAAGGALLTRERRGLRLTSSGERLLPQARQMLALNDEIWTDLNGGAIAGPVRLGAPYDLVGPHLTPVLKAFGAACPHVMLSLACDSSPELLRSVADGRVDIAVLEEPIAGVTGECLAVDRLVWVGARGGRAHSRTPLPVSLVADSCAFSPAVAASLRGQGRAWRTVFENGSLEATFATVRADLAISACLASTVPNDVDVLPLSSGLPELPAFAIALHMPDRQASPATNELARYIRDGLKSPGRTLSR
ncbi:LysR family transcriptional regulator [Bosea sp. 124]|uniref:LysR family transcriptional regulator n=1 Tax=Bosea sp. 124 TaxID=2135642 RepID=UPI000D3D04D5|nr:LysR family transcriptional regulator [Bosea sp. 124]PTM38664.1 LysR family transcriptional regulator [Bosea sp. 124]